MQSAHSANRLPPVKLEQDQGAERKHACEEIEDAAFLVRVAARELIAKREEHEADEEICNP